jgi:hypothetical protein
MARGDDLVARKAWPTAATWAGALIVFATIAPHPAVAQLNPNKQAPPPSGSDSDDDSSSASGSVPGLTGFNGRGLAVSAAMNSRYESNLARRQPADDGLRFQPRISADYGLGSSRLGFFVGGSYGRDIVLGNRFFGGGDRSSANAGVDFELSRCGGEAGGSFRRSLNLRGDSALFGAFQQGSTAYGIAVRCQIGRALSLNAGYTSTSAQTEFGVSQALNVDAKTFTGGLGFDGRGLGQFSLSGSLGDLDFPGRLVVTPDGIVEDGLSQRTLRAGYIRRIGARLVVSLGISLLDNQPGVKSSLVIIDDVPQFIDRSGFTGLGYDASADLQLSSRLGLSFSVTRGVNSNPFVGAFLVISNGYAFSANTKVGRYELSAGARVRRSQFQGGFASDFDPVPRRNDTLQSYFVRFGGRVGNRIRASVELNHNRRKANPAMFNFVSTGVGLNLGMAFGRGSR